MKNHWQIQEAKARLCEVVRAAREQGPQRISVRGEPAAVVVSNAEFERLVTRPQRFAEFIRCSPLAGRPLKLSRDRSRARDVDL